MATTSMHKPGWRSRRRSRLSLVERAVPLLGRQAEDGARTARGGETRSPSDNKSPKKPEAATKSLLKGDRALVRVQHQPHDDRDQASEAAPPAPAGTSEPISKYAPTQISDDNRASSADHVTEAADEAAAPDRLPEKPALAAMKAETSSPPASPTPSAQALADSEAKQVAAMPESWIPSEPDTLATGLVARIETEKSDVARLGEQASHTNPKLELDWDRLIDSGFTDPRDRGRPLSKNMDEIIRALIRQALSDQSSWRDRVILVTSPYERTGKTASAINFAFGLTTVANHHAVLVDVDTTGSGAVDRLGGGDFKGITTAITDESIELDEVVIKTDLERLTLVASGDADDETLDRFASRRMLQILRHLTENPDTILIIDAPPILLSQEAAVLSVIAGQVVLAVEAGNTTADQIEHALQRIGDRHNVSLVLNKCSDIVDKETPKIASRNEPVEAQRRAPSVKRRLPKAVAAGAFVLSLLVFPPMGQTGPTRAFFAQDPMTSTRIGLPPERLPLKTDKAQCHRMCR